nr:TonB-dependent receptor [Carboxylicivirga mesophila]
MLLPLQANTSAQSQKVSLKANGVTLKQVLKEIESQTDVNFIYNHDVVDENESVSVQVNNTDVEDVLKQILSEQHLDFKIIDDKILLFAQTHTKNVNSAQQSEITVRGTVTDPNGDPIPGVNVFEAANPTNGVITGIDGSYTIELSSGESVITFSFIGYDTQTVQVANRSSIDVVLVEEATGLDEVIVVGYGTQKKVNVTAAVTQINSKELGNITTTSIGSALQGQLPGLYVRDAGYNQGLSYQVRGATTIGNNTPLFIVDGIPQNSDNIDPNDIESISVLKDGAASSIYGARAAAGVVLITTKSGKSKDGKAVFNYETYTSWGKLTSTQESMNSVNSAKVMNQASLNSGGTEMFTPDEIQLFENGTDHYYANTNWKDEVLKTERSNRHYLSVSGNNDKTSYLFSLGYKNDDGIMNGIERNKYTLRSNLSTQVTKSLNISANLNYTIIDNTSPSVNNGIDNIYQHMNSTAPFLPVYQSEEDGGGFAYLNQAGAYPRGFWNAVWELQAGSSNYQGSEFTANTAIKWDIIDGLSFTGRYSGVFGNSNNTSYIYSRSYSQGPAWFSDVNSLSKEYVTSRQLNFQNFLNYDKSFGAHSISALAGWDVQFYKRSFLRGGRRAFQFDELLTELDAPNSGDNDDITALSSNVGESALQSGVGRISYNYASKYFIEISGRYDGSSTFAPETRYGFFPAVSGKWALSEENFFNSEFFDYLRIRASYGTSGNNSVNGSYFSAIAFNTYYFGMGDIVAPTASEGSIPFRDLKWETTSTSNLGLEFSLKKGLLSGEIDVYKKVTDDILLASPVQGVVGTNRSGPAINAGSVQNTGVEMILSHQGHVNDFNYRVSLNGTYNKNEILELTDAFSEWGDTRVGDPLGSVYGYVSEGIISTDAEAQEYKSSVTSGIHPNTSAGDIKYKDINNDGILDFNDKVKIGETLPKITWGLRLQADWKNIDFLAFFQGIAGADQYKANDLFGNNAWIPEEANDAWSENNTNGSYPRPLLFAQQTYFQNFYTNSDYWVFNASYLRLKNIQIGYTLPIPDNNILSSVRIYATGTNLLTISNFRPGHDPETGGLGIPPLKTYVIGLNVKF